MRTHTCFRATFADGEIRSTPWSELSWTHFRVLMRVSDPAARQWYACEAAAQTWSVAALDRQISTLYYQRLLSSWVSVLVLAARRLFLGLSRFDF
jgi:hypothetical protein